MHQNSQHPGFESHSQSAYPMFPTPTYGANRYWPPATFSYHQPYMRYHYPLWTPPIGYRHSQSIQYPEVVDPGGYYHPQYYDPRSKTRDIYPYTVTPVIDHKVEKTYRQASSPQPPTEEVAPVMLPPAISKNIRIAQHGQKHPGVSVANPKVKQEISTEGGATLLHSSPFPDETFQAEAGIIGSYALTTEDLLARLLKDEKTRRICVWRAQVDPMSEPDHDYLDERDNDDSEHLRAGTYPVVKRKANTGSREACSSVGTARRSAKRTKLVPEVDIAVSDTSRLRVSVTNGVERNKTPCQACRLAHKKCNGRLSACIHATPRMRTKARPPKVPDSAI